MLNYGKQEVDTENLDKHRKGIKRTEASVLLKLPHIFKSVFRSIHRQ